MRCRICTATVPEEERDAHYRACHVPAQDPEDRAERAAIQSVEAEEERRWEKKA